MIGDEQYEDAAQAAQGPGPSWAPRPANGGNIGPMRTAVGGDMPPAGPARILAARPPIPPELRTPNAGGRAFFGAPAGPGENAGGAFAYAPTMAAKGNGGVPDVPAPTYGGPFGNYTGGAPTPRPASVGAPAEPMQLPKQGALDLLFAQHGQPGARQDEQQGQQGGGRPSEGAAEGAAGEAEAGAEGAGAAEAAGGAAAGGEAGAATLVEALGLL